MSKFHAETPKGSTGYVYIYDESRNDIATCYGKQSQENAERITTALNGTEALKAKLEEIRIQAEDHCDGAPDANALAKFANLLHAYDAVVEASKSALVKSDNMIRSLAVLAKLKESNK